MNVRDAGAILPKGDGDRKSLLVKVAKSESPETLTYVTNVGWINRGTAYVIFDGVIGGTRNKIIGVNRSNTPADPSGRLSIVGTWGLGGTESHNWPSSSSVMILAICIALAAPLLYFLMHVPLRFACLVTLALENLWPRLWERRSSKSVRLIN